MFSSLMTPRITAAWLVVALTLNAMVVSERTICACSQNDTSPNCCLSDLAGEPFGNCGQCVGKLVGCGCCGDRQLGEATEHTLPDSETVSAHCSCDCGQPIPATPVATMDRISSLDDYFTWMFVANAGLRVPDPPTRILARRADFSTSERQVPVHVLCCIWLT